METKKQNYTLPIIVMIFLFGMISFVTNLASPMGDILKYQFKSRRSKIQILIGTIQAYDCQHKCNKHISDH